MGHLAETPSLEILAIASHGENVGGITCKLPKTLALTAAVINGTAVALKSFLAAFHCLAQTQLHLRRDIAPRSVCCHRKLHAVDVLQPQTLSLIGHRETSVIPHGHDLQDVLETHNRRLQISDDAVTPRHRRAGRVLKTKRILHRSINGHGKSPTDFQSYPELVSFNVEVNYFADRCCSAPNAHLTH